MYDTNTNHIVKLYQTMGTDNGSSLPKNEERIWHFHQCMMTLQNPLVIIKTFVQDNCVYLIITCQYTFCPKCWLKKNCHLNFDLFV